MRKLQFALFFSFLLLLSSWLPVSSQEYTITEQELIQLENNNKTIVQSIEQLQKESQNQEKILTEKVMSLNEQLKTMQEFLNKRERDLRIMTYIVIPILSVVASGCFIAGAYVGISM